MKLLVAVASRHGATAEIAARIAEWLEGEHLDVTLAAAGPRTRVAGFDAVVIGSAVYNGRWHDDARAFIEGHAEALRQVPVWLFSSGPLGDPPLPADESPDSFDFARLVDAHGQRCFPGALDKSKLSLAERAVVVTLRAPEGDFRDWDEIRAWAEEIQRHMLVHERALDARLDVGGP